MGFWDTKHRTDDRLWLTGTTLDEYRAFYELPPPGGLAVTEIGVGLGVATRQLAQAGAVVTAVDVSPVALACVASWATRALLTLDLPAAPPADLALCHLVLQHVPEGEMARIFRELPLKPGGTFAFQFAYLCDGRPLDLPEHYWHPREETLELARRCGLDVTWTREEEFPWDDRRIAWTLAKARRTVGPCLT